MLCGPPQAEVWNGLGWKETSATSKLNFSYLQAEVYMGLSTYEGTEAHIKFTLEQVLHLG